MEEINERLESIQTQLLQAYQPTLDKPKIKNLSFEILDLSGEIVEYLNSQDSLSSWAKDHIVEVINLLNWGWLFAALTELRLAIDNPDEIAPENEYREEVVLLNADEIIRHIRFFRKSLEKSE